MAKTRVLTGIQPTGGLHLGNYLGAIKQWVEFQETKDNYICIVDLHAITVPQDPAELRRNTRQLGALLIAAGIDPERTVLFVQSHVRAHAEGSWFLTCVTPLGWLERMTQFKDKAGKQEVVGTGLLTYPVLQAVDILLAANGSSCARAGVKESILIKWRPPSGVNALPVPNAFPSSHATSA